MNTQDSQQILQSKRGSTSPTQECYEEHGERLRIAHHKREEPESAINNYLQSYPATPHPSTDEIPAGQFCTKLPQLPKDYNDHNIKQKDQQYKLTLLAQHNKKYPKQYKFQKGDTILKQNDLRKKHNFVYGPMPWTVTSTKDCSIEITKGKSNQSQLEKVSNSPKATSTLA